MRLKAWSLSTYAFSKSPVNRVACDAQRQLGLLVDELRRLRRLRLRLNRLPEPLQEDEVALDVLLGRTLGCSADDDPTLLHLELAEDVLEPRALLVVEPARDAEALALRDEDDEPAGQRDLRRQARPLRLHRILHRLDEDRLPTLDQILDLTGALAPFELRADDLVDVEEAVLVEADLDERGLHPGQDVVDGAEVDVPGDRPALGPLDVDLGDLAVLDHGDTLLADVDGDEQFALRGRQRCTARGLAAAARILPAPLLPLRERLAALRLLFLLGLRAGRRRLDARRPGLRCGRAVGLRPVLRLARRRRAGLLAAAPSAATTAALGSVGIGCRGRTVGGRSGYDRLEGLSGD